MAKLEIVVKGNLKDFVPYIKTALKNSSVSSSIEDEAYLDYGEIKIAILCFERYSWFGDNRVSMNVTICEKDNELAIVGMSAGGSQATFFKINTVGENKFLAKLTDAINDWKNTQNNV